MEVEVEAWTSLDAVEVVWAFLEVWASMDEVEVEVSNIGILCCVAITHSSG